METTYDIDYDEIQVTLFRKFRKRSSNDYYGIKTSFLNQRIDFMQLKKEYRRSPRVLKLWLHF